MKTAKETFALERSILVFNLYAAALIDAVALIDATTDSVRFVLF